MDCSNWWLDWRIVVPSLCAISFSAFAAKFFAEPAVELKKSVVRLGLVILNDYHTRQFDYIGNCADHTEKQLEKIVEKLKEEFRNVKTYRKATPRIFLFLLSLVWYIPRRKTLDKILDFYSDQLIGVAENPTNWMYRKQNTDEYRNRLLVLLKIKEL